MEIMTKEEYYETMLCELLQAYRSLDERVHALDPNCCEECAANLANGDIIRTLRLEGHDAEIECVLQKRFADAYDEFVESCEKDHIFDVEFHYTVYGKTQVHAKDEDEASDYVNEELRLEDCGNVYFSDDENVADEVTLNDYGEGIEIDSVDDTGDEWDED